MSESTDEGIDPEDADGITDEMLPEDLRPTDDNPLAQAPDDEREEPQLREPGDTGYLGP